MLVPVRPVVKQLKVWVQHGRRELATQNVHPVRHFPSAGCLCYRSKVVCARQPFPISCHLGWTAKNRCKSVEALDEGGKGKRVHESASPGSSANRSCRNVVGSRSAADWGRPVS